MKVAPLNLHLPLGESRGAFCYVNRCQNIARNKKRFRSLYSIIRTESRIMTTAQQIDLSDLLSEDLQARLYEILAEMIDLDKSLLRHLSPAQIERLNECFDDIKADTGYGEIKIPLAAGKTQGISVTKNYKG